MIKSAKNRFVFSGDFVIFVPQCAYIANKNNLKKFQRSKNIFKMHNKCVAYTKNVCYNITDAFIDIGVKSLLC